MTKNSIITWGCILGVAAVVFATVDVRPAWAVRNGAGTYSLPAGNPVTSGTTITSTWANTTLNDIAVALTNSLDRTGITGAMTGPLKLANGTAGAPSLTFASQQNSGLYRAGLSDIRMQVVAVESTRWTDHGVLMPLGADVIGEASETAFFSQGGVSGAAGGFVGGSGATGVNITGGVGNTFGLIATGGTVNGVGVRGIGTGSGTGGDFVGGASSGTAVVATGGMPNGAGGAFQGNGTGPGIRAAAVAPGFAVEVSTGDAKWTGLNPLSNSGFTNTVTPLNIPKAWYRGTNTTVSDGFNISFALCAANEITVNLQTGMANTNYAPVCSVVNGGTATFVSSQVIGTGNFVIKAFNTTGIPINLCAGTVVIGCQVFGRQ